MILYLILILGMIAYTILILLIVSLSKAIQDNKEYTENKLKELETRLTDSCGYNFTNFQNLENKPKGKKK